MQYALALLVVLLSCSSLEESHNQSTRSWQKQFGLEDRKLLPTGRNTFFILEPGYQLVLESNTEKLVITVLDETKNIGKYVTRVVEEREWKNDMITEVSRNFFAIDELTKDVFYFGEEVDMYKGGVVESHSGAWIAGENEANPGLIMPGKPEVGYKYYMELAPRAAMDRAQIISLDDQLATPAGLYTQCLLTKEGSALNPLELEFKTYAPGIGLIQDEKLLLSRYGFADNK